MDIQERLSIDFEEWFAKLQTLVIGEKLNPDDWTEVWFDGSTPEQAYNDWVD